MAEAVAGAVDKYIHGVYGSFRMKEPRVETVCLAQTIARQQLPDARVCERDLEVLACAALLTAFNMCEVMPMRASDLTSALSQPHDSDADALAIAARHRELFVQTDWSFFLEPWTEASGARTEASSARKRVGEGLGDVSEQTKRRRAE